MTTKQAMWVHGTAVQPQREGYHVSRKYTGPGAVVYSTGKEWFQFAIPTPVIFGGHDSKLQQVFVLYETFSGARIDALDIWDGTTNIQAFGNLSLQGTHNVALDASNTWHVALVHIRWGLCLSVEVDFGQATPAGVPAITFASAGADFVIP